MFKIVQKVCKEINISLPPCAVIDSVASSEEVASKSEDELPDDLMLLEDFQTLQVAFDGAQQMLRSSYVNSQLEEQQVFVNSLKAEFQTYIWN